MFFYDRLPIEVPLFVLVSNTSRKEILLSCSSSLVNLIFFVVLLMVCKMSFVLSFFIITN